MCVRVEGPAEPMGSRGIFARKRYAVYTEMAELGASSPWIGRRRSYICWYHLLRQFSFLGRSEVRTRLVGVRRCSHVFLVTEIEHTRFVKLLDDFGGGR